MHSSLEACHTVARGEHVMIFPATPLPCHIDVTPLRVAVRSGAVPRGNERVELRVTNSTFVHPHAMRCVGMVGFDSRDPRGSETRALVSGGLSHGGTRRTCMLQVQSGGGSLSLWTTSTVAWARPSCPARSASGNASTRSHAWPPPAAAITHTRRQRPDRNSAQTEQPPNITERPRLACRVTSQTLPNLT